MFINLFEVLKALEFNDFRCITLRNGKVIFFTSFRLIHIVQYFYVFLEIPQCQQIIGHTEIVRVLLEFIRTWRQTLELYGTARELNGLN